MTSTSFNVGLRDDARSSSRVLHPPGGGVTDIFGGEPEPQRTGRRMVTNPATAALAEQPAKSTSTETTEQNGQATPSVIMNNNEVPRAEPVAAAAPTAPAPNEAGPGPAKNTEPAKPNVEPPRRVRVPPGGFSSGLW